MNLENGVVNRGSYKSAPVLLNLLNKLRKHDKMGGLGNILSLFPNKLDSIYHMTLEIAFFGMKTSNSCHLLCNVIYHYVTKSVNQ